MHPVAESSPRDSDEIRHLRERHRLALEEAYPAVGGRQAEAIQREVQLGYLQEAVWRPDGVTAAGLATSLRLHEGLRVIGLWTEARGPDPVFAMLEDLSESAHTPIVSVTDLLPGLSDDRQALEFGARGFWHRAKVQMRRPAGLVAPEHEDRPELRAIRPADLPAVVGVYVRAYSDRPGEFWTWGMPHAENEAEQDVFSHRGANDGWSNDFLPQSSFVWESEGRVVGAILMSRTEGSWPHVDDLIVEPSHHRHGIGRALLRRAIAECEVPGALPIELAAIRGGAPFRLYQSLGFSELSPPYGRRDGHWLKGPSPY